MPKSNANYFSNKSLQSNNVNENVQPSKTMTLEILEVKEYKGIPKTISRLFYGFTSFKKLPPVRGEADHKKEGFLEVHSLISLLKVYQEWTKGETMPQV